MHTLLLSLSIMHRLHAQQCFLGTNKSYSAIRSVIKSVVSKKTKQLKRILPLAMSITYTLNIVKLN